MKVSIEQLEAGDEIIISSHSDLKYMRVLETPRRSKTKKYWRSGEFAFKNVKCAICKRKEKNPYNGLDYEAYRLDDQDLNSIIYKDLENRDIWLVKKGSKI